MESIRRKIFKMKAHLIMKNELPIYAILDDRGYAKVKLIELKHEEFKNNQSFYYNDINKYNQTCKWYITEVPYEKL